MKKKEIMEKLPENVRFLYSRSIACFETQMQIGMLSQCMGLCDLIQYIVDKSIISLILSAFLLLSGALSMTAGIQKRKTFINLVISEYKLDEESEEV